MVNTDDTSYQEYLDKVDIQEVLTDAGYHHYRRDGLRYPSYVAIDSDGRKIAGDKFLVTSNGKCCFRPPLMKRWNVISFIKEHPELFKDYKAGMKPDRLVHLVCRRLLNEPPEIRNEKIQSQRRDQKPFLMSDYDQTVFNQYDADTVRLFQKFFGQRGIDLDTQKAFQKDFLLVKYDYAEGKSIMNLAFPLREAGEVITKGMEMRGFPMKDGKSYKGLAKGTDATHAVWTGNPGEIRLRDARHVYWFESAYDAMAYYQLKAKDNPELKTSLFISTSGNPSVGQMAGTMKQCHRAAHHICFDNDLAGRQFHANFIDTAEKNGFTRPEGIRIPESMKDYMRSLATLHELYEPKEDSIALLPREIRNFYREHVTVSTERLTSLISAYGGRYDGMKEWQKEDVDMAQFDKNLDDDVFAHMIDEELGLKGKVKMLDIRREIPSEGYKDWNDELLGKPTKSVEKTVSYRDDDGRQVAVTQQIKPEMLRYMESLKDKTNVFSGNQDLLPKGSTLGFKERVLGLLGIRTSQPPQPVAAIASKAAMSRSESQPVAAVASKAVTSSNETQHYHR